MIKKQLLAFLLRWLISSLAMWICIQLFATTSPAFRGTAGSYLLAGLIFSLVNAVIKPFATLISLPAIVLTLGIFILLVNTAMVALTIWLLPDISMDFAGAVLSALTISLINYLANFLVPSYTK